MNLQTSQMIAAGHGVTAARATIRFMFDLSARGSQALNREIGHLDARQ